MKTQAYNGNDIFNVNCNLYGHEYIKTQETLEAIRDEFISLFTDDLTRECQAIGLKFISLECFSPREYNFAGDSIDPTIEVIDPGRYVQALVKYKDEINARLADNKSYDGYLALTVTDVDAEIENARDTENFSPDSLCLSFLLNKKIDFKDAIDIYDCFVYDYDCETEGCENGKESYEDEYCEKCQGIQEREEKKLRA